MNAQPKLILLIDDDDDDNFFHRRAIKKSGLTSQVDVCTSGDVAMDYLQRQGDYASRAADAGEPDLIFLDINMPRVDGWEFLARYARWLEEQQFQPATVIVMLSTSMQESDRARAGATPHVSSYVTKPLTAQGVGSIVRNYFPAAFDE